MNWNRVQLAGHLTRDPDCRHSTSGQPMCFFGLAVNRNYTDSNGQKQEETCFVEVNAFGKIAGVLGEKMKKGSNVFVEWRLNLNRWNDKETGKERTTLNVIAERFEFVEKRKNEVPE